MNTAPKIVETEENVMRLCRHCADIAVEKELEEAESVTVETSEGKRTLAQLPYDFADHIARESGAWGWCDACKAKQWPNPIGPLHEGEHAPLRYFRGIVKDLKTLYTISAWVYVKAENDGHEWKLFNEQTLALSRNHATRTWLMQFQGKGNYKPHRIIGVAPTLGFYVNDKDGKKVSDT